MNGKIFAKVERSCFYNQVYFVSLDTLQFNSILSGIYLSFESFLNLNMVSKM